MARQGAHVEAAYWLEQAAQGNPRNANFHFNLSYHLWKTRKFARALESLSETLNHNPVDSETHYLLHKCVELVRRNEEAIATWEQALKLKPTVEIWKMRKYTPDLYRVHEGIDLRSFRKLNFQEDPPEHFWNALKEFSSGRLSQAGQQLVQLISKIPLDADAYLLMARFCGLRGRHGGLFLSRKFQFFSKIVLRPVSSFQNSIFPYSNLKKQVLRLVLP